MGNECGVKLGQKWTKNRSKIVSNDSLLHALRVQEVELF